MDSKGRFATILIALTLFGCKEPLQTSAASAGVSASSGSSGGGATSGGDTRTENIVDTTMDNKVAFYATIREMEVSGDSAPGRHGHLRILCEFGVSSDQRRRPELRRDYA